MKPTGSLLSTLALASWVTFLPAEAEVIASTTFDGRTLSEVNVPEDTATGIIWTVNGIEDPGDMTALNAGEGGLRLFNAQPDVQNLFAPGINTGNGNTFWTTTVSLTVLPGASVTLTDITFDNWSISSAQVQNVNRRSDFTFTVIDPSGTTVASVEVEDSMSGTGVGVPTVTATFENPVPLTSVGTYLLKIKGGDFAGSDETGNHTAIDNLTINGEVGGGSGLEITEIDFNPETKILSLTWNSTPGQFYVIRFSQDLQDWEADLEDGYPADPGESTTAEIDLNDTAASDFATAFFRIEPAP